MFKTIKSLTNRSGQPPSGTVDTETLAYMEELGARIVRIETILCKLCLHHGMDPRTGGKIVGSNKTNK